MEKVLFLLKKYNVSEYEVVTLLASGVEQKIDYVDNESLEKLLDDLNVLSWNVNDTRCRWR